MERARVQINFNKRCCLQSREEHALKNIVACVRHAANAVLEIEYIEFSRARVLDNLVGSRSGDSFREVEATTPEVWDKEVADLAVEIVKGYIHFTLSINAIRDRNVFQRTVQEGEMRW